jgi:hypothetical protein
MVMVAALWDTLELFWFERFCIGTGGVKQFGASGIVFGVLSTILA